jgi:hypothetical protein
MLPRFMRRGLISEGGSLEMSTGVNFLVPSRRFSRVIHIKRLMLGFVLHYLHSLDNLFALGLFNSAVAALISHKIMIIRLHSPLPILGLIITGPCLFVFDFITLMIIHKGLASSKRLCNILAGLGSVFIILCSATFASLYIEGNVELNWARSVEVHLL